MKNNGKRYKVASHKDGTPKDTNRLGKLARQLRAAERQAKSYRYR